MTIVKIKMGNVFVWSCLIFNFINKAISSKEVMICFWIISKVILWTPPHTHECVDMIHPSVPASGAVIKSIGLAKSFLIVFSLSVASPTFDMTRKQVVRKPDWASRKCSDVHQPHVQDRKADSPKLLFKLRQTVSLQEWWGMAYLCNQILTLGGSCQAHACCVSSRQTVLYLTDSV